MSHIYRFSYAMRHNDNNRTTHSTPSPTTPSYLRHFQSLGKIDSFLKPVLNICILDNLIVGWGGWVIIEGPNILHQIFRYSGGVNIWGRIASLKNGLSTFKFFSFSICPFFLCISTELPIAIISSFNERTLRKIWLAL